MIRARKDGLILVFLGATVVLLLMAFLVRARSSGAVQDFIAEYTSARCLIAHCDPYSENDVLRIYRAEGGERSLNDDKARAIATRFVYPPSAFAVTVPFALLPWQVARLAWMLTSACALILGAVLAWELARPAPILAGAFAGYLLANSEVLVVLSNPSGLAIGLTIVGAWSILRERWAWAGVLALALALCLKPQNAGPVWLFFLLAGGLCRRRALQAFAVTAALAVPMVLWVGFVSPHWMHELGANLQAFSVHGGLNDPGPSSRVANEFIDLQVVFSRFWDASAFYNAASLLAILPVLVLWAAALLRTRPTAEHAVLGLATVVPLALLPVHHHLYDTKLLLLTLPALAVVWSRGGRTARVALGLTAAAFFYSGDLSGSLWMKLLLGVPVQPGSALEWVLNAGLTFPVPLLLLALGIFYLRQLVLAEKAATNVGTDGESPRGVSLPLA